MKNTLKAPNLSRRRFIVGSAAVAGGGLALGLPLAFDGSGSAAAAGKSAAQAGAEVNAWVVIRPDDTCVIRIARSEMGQGTETGHAQPVAKEREGGWADGRRDVPTHPASHAR